MKMDTSFWTQLNPNIRVESTVKLAFNRYAYKMEISCTGVTYLRGGFSNVWDFVDSRRQARQQNWGGSWRAKYIKVPSDEEIETLQCLQNLLESDDFKLKRRIEEPVIQLYAESMQDLIDFARKFPHSRRVTGIMLPRTAEEQTLIEQGLVIRRKPVAWKYRFNLREARYSWETRQQLSNYLDNLGEAVHVPAGLQQNLRDPKNHYIWGGYIDADDRSLATFIRLIDPAIIRSIDEFHEISNGK